MKPFLSLLDNNNNNNKIKLGIKKTSETQTQKVPKKN
jgi:hypothetical protein